MITVAIVGKPNVGKSSLFNRVISEKKSIVDDKPGITRDRIFAKCEWLTKEFEIIDTGGFSLKELTFQQNINLQVELAINQANIIIYMVSYQNGIDNDDIYISKLLKKEAKNKKIIFVMNKAENYKESDLSKFYTLGFGKPLIISCAHGIGIGDLLDQIVKDKNFNFNNTSIDNEKTTFCILGKPNVGKSSLVNSILHQNRVIVSEIAGTTIDPIDIDFSYNKKKYCIIDTAGIRQKSKIVGIEKYALLRSNLAISKAQIILLMFDGSTDFSELDQTVAGMAFKANIPIVIVINKIDLIQEFNDTKRKELINNIRNKFQFISWAPIVFISAKDNLKINKIFDLFEEINKQKNIKVSNSLLNDVVAKAQMLQNPPLHMGGRINISYVTQVQAQVPTFVLFCTNVKCLHFSYARYMENQIRKAFGINLVPIVLYWKDKNTTRKNKLLEK